MTCLYAPYLAGLTSRGDRKQHAPFINEAPGLSRPNASDIIIKVLLQPLQTRWVVYYVNDYIVPFPFVMAELPENIFGWALRSSGQIKQLGELQEVIKESEKGRERERERKKRASGGVTLSCPPLRHYGLVRKEGSKCEEEEEER
jgi:hypothetical protein